MLRIFKWFHECWYNSDAFIFTIFHVFHVSETMLTSSYRNFIKRNYIIRKWELANNFPIITLFSLQKILPFWNVHCFKLKLYSVFSVCLSVSMTTRPPQIPYVRDGITEPQSSQHRGKNHSAFWFWLFTGLRRERIYGHGYSREFLCTLSVLSERDRLPSVLCGWKGGK